MRLEAGLFTDACAFLPRLHPDEPTYAPEHQTSDSPAYGRVLHNALHATGAARDWDRYLRHQQALERSFARAEAALLRLRREPSCVLPEPDTQHLPSEPIPEVEPQPEHLPNEAKSVPAAPSRSPTTIPALLVLFPLLVLTPKTAQTNPIQSPRQRIFYKSLQALEKLKATRPAQAEVQSGPSTATPHSITAPHPQKHQLPLIRLGSAPQARQQQHPILSYASP